jgi:glycosyltransferase involved in cell wall biosynthesis
MGGLGESGPRVVYVLDAFPLLTETFVANELLELRRRGVDVAILALRRPPRPLGEHLIAGSPLGELTSYERADFPRIVRAFAPSLLHAHFATAPTALARDLSQSSGIPFTFTAHGYDVWRRPPEDWAARARAAAKVVTVSDANARHIAGTFGVPREKIAVIRNGVDVRTFRPAPSGATRDDDPPLVVCVARHESVKNLDLLQDACALLQARGVRFRCVVVGDGRCRDALEARRRDLGLERVLEFVGAMPPAGVLGWWRRAAVAVLTSDSEGLPVSLIEAAACGVPAVATAVGGIPELIEHGVTGLLVPPRDAGAVAAALEALLTHPARAAAMGAAARRRAEREFSLARQVDALVALWCDILRAPARSAGAQATA